MEPECPASWPALLTLNFSSGRPWPVAEVHLTWGAHVNGMFVQSWPSCPTINRASAKQGAF